MIMSNELFWLVLTVAMTGLMWLPYILDRIMVRGLIGAMANPSPSDKAQSPWARRLMAAHTNAVENLIVFAPLVLTTRALGIATAVTVRLRALFLVAACPRRGLYTRHSCAAHTVIYRRLRGAGAARACDLQIDMKFRSQTVIFFYKLRLRKQRNLFEPGGLR
jgi:uncharacterized MAPEG superfamily protein